MKNSSLAEAPYRAELALQDAEAPGVGARIEAVDKRLYNAVVRDAA